ncbi:MAG: flagellar protein FlgN [Deltaproteobacteria bacterium]|nr:flagellar protein FlgN [Deltaproteobacteria bacterium]
MSPIPLAPIVARLEAVLAAEERLYVELRDALQRERDCMVMLDAEGLEAVVAAKEALADEAALLEETRRAVADELAAALGLAAAPTLSALCERLGRVGAALRERHSRLVALLAAVGELVDANAGFARESLAHVRETLASLGRLLPCEPVYTPAGARAAAGGPGRLVERVA